MTSLLTWDQVRDIVWSTEAEVQFLRFGRIAAPIKITIPAPDRDHVRQFLDERLKELTSAEMTDAADQDGLRDAPRTA